MEERLPAATSIFTPGEDTKIIGVIQFVHGMCEHKGRYKDVISFFNQQGFVCIIADMPGHGESVVSLEDLGYFGEHGDKKCVDTVHAITKFIKINYPDLPYILIGHSMGSLIVRNFIKQYDDELDGLFVIGSPSNSKPKCLAKAAIRLMTLLRGERYRSRFMNRLVVGAFSARFRHEGSSEAWLTEDKDVWEEFHADERCGFIFTLNGFDSLINLISGTYSKKGWEMKNPSLPITFLSGEKDACMINRPSFDKAVNTLRKAGYKNVHFKLFEGRRHEILNDFHKEEVYEDILKIIKQILSLRQDTSVPV